MSTIKEITYVQLQDTVTRIRKKLVAEREQVLYMPKMHRFSSQAQMKTAGI